MKRLILLIAALLCIISVAIAVPVNFTPFVAYGDAWKANNDTHTMIMWNATGNHIWLSTGNASSVCALVQAAGAAGGNNNGAGGAAGGLILQCGYSVSGLVNVTVGDGGVGQNNYNIANDGRNSSFANSTPGNGINAKGGGHGGNTSNTGGNGGSGGGGGYDTQAGGAGIAGQGFAGGYGGPGSGEFGGGGGGGSGSIGVNGSASKGGDGGFCTNVSSMFGTAIGVGGNLSGGGGGSSETTSNNFGLGRCAGAGNGGRSGQASTSATAGTGSGGGGARSNSYSSGSGASGIVAITYITGGIAPPVASFTCTPTSQFIGSAIACTDTSTGPPTNWTWYWNDNGNTSTTQNPSYTYSHTGTYSVNLSVNNTAGSSWSNRSNYITITNATGFTQQDLWQVGIYNQTFIITDSQTNAPIPVVIITDESSQTFTTTIGTGYLSQEAGVHIAYFASTGYVGKALSYVVDGDATHLVQLTPSSPGGTQSTWYSPHQVRFAVVDSMGSKVVGATVNATVIAATFPQDSTADWLTQMYGINPEAANDMLNGTLIMHGTTQSDGATVFTMHSSIGYLLTVTNPKNNVMQTVNVTPIDSIYTIHLLGSSVNNTYMDMGYNTSLYITEPDVHNVTMNLAYQDMSARTTLLEFFVLANVNNTVINYQSATGFGSNVVLMNYTVPNIRPNQYSWYYNGVRTK